MKKLVSLFLGVLLLAHAASGTVNILFVGNSFTHGNREPVLSFGNTEITDANGTHQGGVPGIFKQLTMQAGLSYNVTIEAVSAKALAYHLASRSSIIVQPKWNVVVLQEYSTRPLPDVRGGSRSEFDHSVRALRDLVLTANPAAKVYLYETWARPDLCIPETSTYGHDGQGGSGLKSMQADLHDAYAEAGAIGRISGVAPVGDAFLRAVNLHLADPDGYYHGSATDRLQLWNPDNYHASRYGCYLSAAVLLDEVAGVDPRTLGAGPGTAAEALQISPSEARELEDIAYETVAKSKLSALPK